MQEPFNPKSEIETGNPPQSLGHKRIEKISTDHFGYASVFSIRFCSKTLRHLAGLNFGVRNEITSLARLQIDDKTPAASAPGPKGRHFQGIHVVLRGFRPFFAVSIFLTTMSIFEVYALGIPLKWGTVSSVVADVGLAVRLG